MTMFLGWLLVGWTVLATVSSQKPPLSLWVGGVLERQFDPGDHRNSREAGHGVWIRGGQVYKIYNSKKKGADKAYGETTAAQAAGVPSPHMDFLTGRWYNAQGRQYDVKVLRTIELTGYRFQLGTTGSQTIKDRIKAAANRDVWITVKNSLVAAQNFKLQDPQGFFEASSTPPISFIDIHKGRTQNAGITDLITFVDQLLSSKSRSRSTSQSHSGSRSPSRSRSPSMSRSPRIHSSSRVIVRSRSSSRSRG